MHCAFEGHVGAAIVEVDAWVAHAWETEAWLAEQGTGGWPDETIEGVRAIAAWNVPNTVRQQWWRDKRSNDSNVSVVYRVIEVAKKGVAEAMGAWTVRLGGVCANRPSRVQRAGAGVDCCSAVKFI